MKKEQAVERFLRGDYKSATFQGAQLLTDQEHEAVCAHIEYLTKQLEAMSKAGARLCAIVGDKSGSKYPNNPLGTDKLNAIESFRLAALPRR